MDEDAGRWMTFAELAAARGTTKRAAVMLIRRHKWRRQKNNEGHTIALVPATWAEPVAGHVSDERSNNAEGNGDENSSGHSDHYSDRALEALERSFSALQEAHVAEVSALREAHTAEVAGLRARLTDAQAQAYAAEKAARKAEEAAEALRQAEAERKARGRWTRLKQAWKGR